MVRTIEVTQEDIENGKRHSCDKCPIALAVQRTFKERWIVSATFAAPYQRPGVADLPNEAMSFVVAFDADTNVFPFAFELNDLKENENTYDY